MNRNKMKNSINLLYKSLTLGLVLLASSCSDNFKEVPSATGSTIVAVASANQDFSILAAALTKTGQVNNLNNNNSGSFTVFAPTDAAFISFFNTLPSTIVLAPGSPAGPYDEAGVINLINGLQAFYPIPPNPALGTGISYLTTSGLSSVLTYHILSSKITSDKVTGAQGFVTQNGARLSVSKTGSNVILNAARSINAAGNGATVILADQGASNGVIHAIDKVLIPVSLGNIWAGGTTGLPGFTVNYNNTPPTISVFGAAMLRNADGTLDISKAAVSSTTEYNLISMAIARAELATVIIPNVTPLPDFTLFAPRDADFVSYLGVADETAARATLNGLLPSALADILKYHVVAGRIVSTDLSDGLVITTVLSGQTFSIGISGNVITLKDNNAATDPTIVTASANVLTNAGVLHQINGVLRSN
jgi:uncharacterized surface protein with fasciclin (FAS1) repeats